jgi:hypothetical protein
MFKITDGKGFHMQFDNGWTVSVQWGRGNYCDNYSKGDFTQASARELGAAGSTTAEVGIWYGDGEMEIHAHMTAGQVAELIAKVASYPKV